MTDKQKIQVQRWWMDQLRDITRKVMAQEEKRIARVKKKNADMIGDLGIERREDIDDLYGYGAITEKKRDKLIDIWEQGQNPDELYQAKIDLLQDAYTEAKHIMQDLGQEV